VFLNVKIIGRSYRPWMTKVPTGMDGFMLVF
jgi:hypothetical protein